MEINETYKTFVSECRSNCRFPCLVLKYKHEVKELGECEVEKIKRILLKKNSLNSSFVKKRKLKLLRLRFADFPLVAFVSEPAMTFEVLIYELGGLIGPWFDYSMISFLSVTEALTNFFQKNCSNLGC